MNHVVTCLKENGIVILPTDTVYGIACAMNSALAFERIYDLKGREAKKPCALLISGIEEAYRYWQGISTQTLHLAREGWPGALTLIGPKSAEVPDYITAGLDKVGLRVPDCRFVRDVILGLGQPLAATSANLAGDEAPRMFASISEQLMIRVDWVVDGGTIESRGASRVIDASEGDSRILRQ